MVNISRFLFFENSSYKANIVTIHDINLTPTSYLQAMQLLDAAHWQHVMQEEFSGSNLMAHSRCTS
jgi:hypothetical protein